MKQKGPLGPTPEKGGVDRKLSTRCKLDLGVQRAPCAAAEDGVELLVELGSKLREEEEVEQLPPLHG
jgi:hypothetical protein